MKNKLTNFLLNLRNKKNNLDNLNDDFKSLKIFLKFPEIDLNKGYSKLNLKTKLSFLIKSNKLTILLFFVFLFSIIHLNINSNFDYENLIHFDLICGVLICGMILVESFTKPLEFYQSEEFKKNIELFITDFLPKNSVCIDYTYIDKSSKLKISIKEKISNSEIFYILDLTKKNFPLLELRETVVKIKMNQNSFKN